MVGYILIGLIILGILVVIGLIIYSGMSMGKFYDNNKDELEK